MTLDERYQNFTRPELERCILRAEHQIVKCTSEIKALKKLIAKLSPEPAKAKTAGR